VREPEATVERGRERRRRERRRPDVEVDDEHGAERRGSRGHERRRRERPTRRAADGPKAQRDQRDERSPERRRERLEAQGIPLGVADRRQDEHRERPGRILDVEVAVGDLAGQNRVAARPVLRRVADLRVVEQADVGQRAGRDEDAAGERGPEGRKPG
jgi:hypothetical protein